MLTGRKRLHTTVEVTIEVPITVFLDSVEDIDGEGNNLGGPDTYAIDEIEVEDGATLQRIVRAAIKETCMSEINAEIRKMEGEE